MPASEDARELRRLLQATLDAAREGGEIAMARFRAKVHCERKADGTPVSEVDLAVDALLRERLMAALPEAGWLSEESTVDDGWLARERAWVVDPLDGTGGYLRCDPHWCCAIALLEDGAPVLGVIHAAALGRTWWAARGLGAFVNGTRARVSPREELEGASLVAPASVRKPTSWRTPWPQVRTRRYPSLALRLAKVASGEMDGMLALGEKRYWDVASGDIIVREAGGRVSDARGQPLRYDRSQARVDGVIAAPPSLFGPMLALTRGWRGCSDRHGKGKHP